MAKGKPATDPMANRPDHVGKEQHEMPQGDNQFYPRVKLMQALSPELDKTEEAYIPDAEVGFLLIEGNPPQLIDGEDGIIVIVLAVKKRYAEYGPNRGGFVASYDSREAMEAGVTPGNDVSSVIEYLCMVEGIDEVMVVSFASPTALGVAQKWGKMIEQYETLSGVKYRIKGRAAKNQKNQTYYKMDIQPAGWADEGELKMANDIKEEHVTQFLPAPGQDSEI